MVPVHVFATIFPKADHYDEVLHALLEIVPSTREEAGCRRFELNTGVGADRNLYLVEVWDNHAALEGHHTMAYTISAAEQIAGRLQSETAIVLMAPTG